ncbi:BEN domain-containing protein 5 [Frankliniella fusca]|uniref:BEN domain-containing protein 5 n=1 Tax=Frankliniella fusca TaxID=407009 RepID=A0AAE1HGG9_9NEOP|nr:BEN domain-containing protein 5 [Frankliniella fusca]
MELKLAYVNFFREKRGRRVVDIQKTVEFAPKAHGDFDEDKTYKVKWPLLKKDGSESDNEGEYEAKIICLGVDLADLEQEANVKGLKLPAVTTSASGKKSSKEQNKSSKRLISRQPSKAKKPSKVASPPVAPLNLKGPFDVHTDDHGLSDDSQCQSEDRDAVTTPHHQPHGLY